MSRSIIRTITTAIAIAALAAPTALARPADPPAVTTVEHKQDARSPDAIDAATRPALGSQANPPLDATPQATADSGIAWTTIGIGVAAGLLAIGAIAGIASRTRRARIAA